MRKLCFTERSLQFSKIAHKSLGSSNSLSSLFFFSLCLISSLASPFFSHGRRSLSFFPPSVWLQERRRPGGFLPSRVQRQSGSAGARSRRRGTGGGCLAERCAGRQAPGGAARCGRSGSGGGWPRRASGRGFRRLAAPVSQCAGGAGGAAGGAGSAGWSAERGLLG
jgi:hypothetical protein